MYSCVSAHCYAQMWRQLVLDIISAIVLYHYSLIKLNLRRANQGVVCNPLCIGQNLAHRESTASAGIAPFSTVPKEVMEEAEHMRPTIKRLCELSGRSKSPVICHALSIGLCCRKTWIGDLSWYGVLGRILLLAVCHLKG